MRPYELRLESDTKTNDPNEIANEFNNFFTTCVQNLRDGTTPSGSNLHHLEQFVQDKIPNDEKFIIPPISINDLLMDITRLDPNKSAGSDNIGPRIPTQNMCSCNCSFFDIYF